MENYTNAPIRKEKRMKIDIIIPIYNAYEYTFECIRSVIENTDMNKHNLVLINDKSTDARIEEYLDKLDNQKISNIHIMHNDQNLGFIGTVNRGMKFSNNDVVLLNSDTEVTKRWLEKLEGAAYLNKAIASVTPLTNNGTICSVPHFCEDNELPSHLTLNKYAEIIEKTSLHIYPSIPTAIGFCMYIKREVINKIGFFDAETFGKGYGEENDFCCRAIEQGYYHVLCDDTFIYHKGKTSFLGDSEKYTKDNLKLLNNRYPYYESMIHHFIVSNPLKDIHDNIKLQLKIRNEKKNVLFVLHNDFLKGENHPIGGTEYHVKDIVDHLKDTNAFIMYVKETEIHLDAMIDGSNNKFIFNLSDVISNTQYSNYNYKNQVDSLIDYFEIDCIHIQHLRTHTLDIIDLAREKDIPIHMTLHDFYLACPKVNFLDYNNQYCIDSRSTEKCEKCINESFGYHTNVLEHWNEVMYAYLKKIDRIFMPSKSAKEIFENYYKSIYKDCDINIEVIEHGMELSKGTIVNKNNAKDKFRIAFIGGIAPYKGSQIIHNLIVNSKDNNIEWHIFGNIGDVRLNLLDKKSLIKHGRYDRNNIIDLLNENDIDLVCIFSIWPETYSYTISEAIVSEIPLLVSDIGALGERVKRYDCGWTINHECGTKDILELITDIQNDEKQYMRKKENCKNIKLPNKEEVAKIYEDIYQTSKKRKLVTNAETNNKMLMVYRFQNIKENGSLNLETVYYLQRQIGDLEHKINLMEGTMGWKLLNYIRRYFPRINNLGKKAIYLAAIFKRIKK